MTPEQIAEWRRLAGQWRTERWVREAVPALIARVEELEEEVFLARDELEVVRGLG